MAVYVATLKLPVVERSADESAGTLSMYATLLRNPVTWLYFLSIVAYVGCEQGSADWMSQFLYRYHGFDPHSKGAAAVSYFWGLLTAGCLVGMLLLKLYDSRRVLIAFSVGALLTLSLALFGPPRCRCLPFRASACSPRSCGPRWSRWRSTRFRRITDRSLAFCAPGSWGER